MSYHLLGKKAIQVLVNYLKDKYPDISPKKNIVIIDNTYCIPNNSEYQSKIDIFDNVFKYLVFIHENPIKQYIKIKERVYGKELNALIITDKRKLLTRSFYTSEFKIYPKDLIDYYFESKKNINISIQDDINDLSYLIWDSIDFLQENLDRYKNKLTDKHVIEILFKEVMKNEKVSIYLLNKILFNPKLIIEIYNNEILKNLKDRINNFILNNFPQSLCKIIEKCIKKENFKDLFTILIIVSYIKQFNQDLSNFEVAFKYLNQKANFIEILDEDRDIVPLTKEIQKIGEIGDAFINLILKIILDNQELMIKEIERFINFPRIIRTIETNINLFEKNKTTHKSLFFPKISNLNKEFNKILYDVSNFWLSFNFLELYIIYILKMFFSSSKLKGLTKNVKLFTALNFKLIDKFKNNIFYKCGNSNSEYCIKLNFIENFFEIILCLYHLKNFVIPVIYNKKDDDKVWKHIFEKYYIPLNNSIEAFIENTLQFIPSIIGSIEQYISELEKLIFTILFKINSKFAEYLVKNYEKWVTNFDDKLTPLNVVNALKRLYFKNQLSGLNTFNLVLFIDCCHLDIWNILKQKMLEDFPNLYVETKIGYSILPTLTKYARMALFSGNYPIDFQSNDELKEFFRQVGKPTNQAYIEKMKNHFITNCENMFDFKVNMNNIKKSKENFQVSIFNFSDKTSHTYSQNFLKTLINSIYNSKIRPLLEFIIRNYKDFVIFYATDHGCSRCTEIFDWENQKFNRYWENAIFHKRGARTFISYKLPLNFNDLTKRLICIKHTEAKKWGLPSNIKLPKNNLFMDVSYFFATNYFNLKKTPENKRNLENFGHGGASLDEMIIPFAIIKRKSEDYLDFNWDIDVDISIENGTKNTHIYKIIIKNSSNKEIIFDKGHLITEYIHYKFMLYDKYKISNDNGDNVRQIKFRFLNKYLPTKLSFYFSFYQDEKMESSKIYYA